jgi:hypothetical protein
MANGFFNQFLLSPTGIDAEIVTSITRTIDAVAEQYGQLAREKGVEGRVLPFGRPLYLLVADADDGLCVTYSNENAVRGSTQWFYMDVRGKGFLQGAMDAIIQIAQRDVGLRGCLESSMF